ncbi:hypothetical protein AAC387_Pa01g0802 [Persea americana]
MCPGNESQTSFHEEHLLLPKEGENGIIDRIGEADVTVHGFPFWPAFNKVAEELVYLARITCPIVITSFLLFSRSIISTHFLGRLGGIELAGGSLAIGFANITGYSLHKGLAMGMDPICAQAYGAKRWKVLSQTYQRTLLLLLLFSIPISLLWINMEQIMLWTGQDPAITPTARIYLLYCLPDLLANALLQPLRIFLRAQGQTTPLAVSAAIALALHYPINYLLVEYMGKGVKGVALATAWNTMNLNVGLLMYLGASQKALKPWAGAGRGSLKGWRPLMKLSMVSAMSVCLEWWWYEAMTVVCGLLEQPKWTMGAMGVMIQMTGLLYVVPSSVSLGLSTRVGHELGAGRAEGARRAACCGMWAAAGMGLGAMGFTVGVRGVWGRMFTEEEGVLGLLAVALPIAGLCEVGNYPQTAGCGVLTGSARPGIGGKINFGAFYLVGLPVAVGLGFGTRVGFEGVWLGLLAAQATCAILMVRAVLRTDWELQAERARELTMQSSSASASGNQEDNDEEEEDDLEASLLR